MVAHHQSVGAGSLRKGNSVDLTVAIRETTLCMGDHADPNVLRECPPLMATVVAAVLWA